MVVEDSAHTYVVTAKALELYHDLVAPGCYFVVEDGIVEDEEVCPPKWYSPGSVGKAITEFIDAHPGFQRQDLAHYELTMNIEGWLFRV